MLLPMSRDGGSTISLTKFSGNHFYLYRDYTITVSNSYWPEVQPQLSLRGGKISKSHLPINKIKASPIIVHRKKNPSHFFFLFKMHPLASYLIHLISLWDQEKEQGCYIKNAFWDSQTMIWKVRAIILLVGRSNDFHTYLTIKLY